MRPVAVRTAETGFRGVTARDHRQAGPSRTVSVTVILVAETSDELDGEKALEMALACARRLMPTATVAAAGAAGRGVNEHQLGYYRYFEVT